MGNIFLKTQNQNSISTNSLSKSILSENMLEQIHYINDKLNGIDDKIYVLESHIQANLKVLSSDIHLLNKKINKSIK